MPRYSEARQTIFPRAAEAAAIRAVHFRAYSYKSIKSILENGFDSIPLKKQKEVITDTQHENIRGKEYYE